MIIEYSISKLEIIHKLSIKIPIKTQRNTSNDSSIIPIFFYYKIPKISLKYVKYLSHQHVTHYSTVPSYIAIDVLCWSPLFLDNLFLMMFIAGWIGTDVKSALTSYEMIHSSCWSLMPLSVFLSNQKWTRRRKKWPTTVPIPTPEEIT